MYELWLALNILFELALTAMPLLIGVAALLAVLLIAARAKGVAVWKGGWRVALVAGVVVTAGGMLVIPALTKSSLAQVGYWVDWANLFAVAGGFGAVAALLALPLAALACGSGRKQRAA